MKWRVALTVLWMVLLAHYGLLRIAVEFSFGLAVIFVGSVVLFGVADAIRTRDRPGPPQARTAEDGELAELRHIAGL